MKRHSELILYCDGKSSDDCQGRLIVWCEPGDGRSVEEICKHHAWYADAVHIFCTPCRKAYNKEVADAKRMMQARRQAEHEDWTDEDD